MSESFSTFLVWSGSLQLGDTPGPFADAMYTGLLLQIPLAVTFAPDGTDPIRMVLVTSDVEIFNDPEGNPYDHPVFWNWEPGTSFPKPVGVIDDKDPIPAQPEKHLLTIPADVFHRGNHTLTIVVNNKVDKGLRDDFILQRIEAEDVVGIKIGWDSSLHEQGDAPTP